MNTRPSLEVNIDEHIRDKAKAMPKCPGCYLFCDKKDRIIYVGKAKDLNNRVRSYFTQAATNDERIAPMVKQIANIKHIEAPSELDALLLEHKLIKQHKPWFNSQLKPDLQRPYLRISADKPYPSISISKERADDKASYYDFFKDEYDVADAITLLGRAWGLPQCGKEGFSESKSPCIYHTLDSCMAPCSAKADAGAYADAILEVKRLFRGQKVSKINELLKRMHSCSEEMDFKKAAALKQLVDGLERLRYNSRRRFHMPDKGAVLVLIKPYRESAFSAFLIVDRQLQGRADLPGCCSEAAVRDAASALLSSTGPIPGSQWILPGLLEILADKRMVELPRKNMENAVVKAIIKYAGAAL